MKASLVGAATAVLMSVLTGYSAAAQVPTAQVVSKSQLIVGKQYYIAADTLNVRSSNSTTANNVVGKLSRNDVVEVYDVLNEASPLVQVKIINSSTVSSYVAAEFYVSKDYLSDKQLVLPTSRYFVVQNIATEKTRIYERCTTSPGCAHKMVMETDTVVGRPEEGDKSDPNAYKTWVGHSRISEWVKFYQDGKGFYPRWYTPGQSLKDIPGAVTDSMSLYMGARKWSVRNDQGKSSIHGAFGWYAAKLTPAGENGGVNYQWIHGTIGWGKDGAKPIEITRMKMINFFSNPGSHGCTRLENQAVAYMRHLLGPGTDIYRVYAREATRDTSLSRYRDSQLPLPWDWMLLTNGAAQSNGLTADAATIRAQGVSVHSGNLIEKGTYRVDRYPTVSGLNYSKSASSGLSGDRYEIDAKAKGGQTHFRGYFLIDEGRFVDYAHPNYNATRGAVRIGGLPDFTNSVPEFLQAQRGNIVIPEIVR
ncbi:L,D-transpeptidase [Bdellovibrio sp.]|uniref:L,D-transpeptidase family protein n=1 Tax=Bdellovibrio TaxID=958 RepID=UPI003221C093